MAKILLVEDNEMNRDMLSRRLARKGHEVVVGEDGQKAVDAGCDDDTEPVELDRLRGKIDALLNAAGG